MKPRTVYVDAKILNMHDRHLPKEACVGYFVKGTTLSRAKWVDATESDDAEIQAILFAIDDLKEKLARFTIVCDHESVVSEAKRETVRHPTDLMNRLRESLAVNRRYIKLQAMQANPAHKVLTEFANNQKSVQPS